MVELDALAEKIFALLKGNGLKIKIFDVDGNEVTDPTQGRRFFVVTPNIMVTVDDESSSIEFSKGADVDESAVENLQKGIRKLGDEFLMNSTIKVFGKSIQPRDYSYQAKIQKEPVMEQNMKPVNHHLLGLAYKKVKYFGSAPAYTLADDMGVDLSELQPVLNRLVSDGKIAAIRDDHGDIAYSVAVDEAITESLSKMFGSARTSQQTMENVRILVRHKTPVDENVRGSRTRHIGAIFLECNGERIRFPHNYLPGARAMAQHMAHGGTMFDKVGSYISESTDQLIKLQSFNRYVTTNNLVNEGSSSIVDTVKENIQTIRTELKKLTGSKTYETVKARLETFEREPLSEDDTTQLKDLFTIRRFDEKFEAVLPIVKQLVQEKDTYYKRIEEAASSTVVLRRESMNTTPMFEFASENASLGFKLNELAMRITENDELAGFINKIGSKLCKEGTVNQFERAILSQVFENATVAALVAPVRKDIKESSDIDAFFNRFDYKFM